MTPEQRSLALWGGAAGAAAVLALAWIGMRSGDLDGLSAKADKAYAEYERLYPAVGGESAKDALDRLTTLAGVQSAALAEAERGLLAELPAEYRIDDLNQATNQARADLERLRQAGLSRRVVMPALPFQGAALAQDPGQRRLQLAQLWLVRRTVELLLEAGVARIGQISLAGGALDPDSVYGALFIQVVCDAPQPVALDLLQRLRGEHARGLGLREAALMPARDQVAMTLKLSLLLPARDCAGFGLAVEPPPAAVEVPEGGAPAPAAGPLQPLAPAPQPAQPAAGSSRNRFGGTP
ncbi:MAG: hypothetical protein RLZZ127_867 [Planctomycetota bacterium]|jgi:hypothetical protein